MSVDEFKVWHRSIGLVREVYSISAVFSRAEMYGLTSQVRRAAVSVPANIAESHERRTTPDYVRFLAQAQGSLAEVRTHLLIAIEVQYINREAARDVLDEIDQIARMLNAARQSLIPDP